MQLVINATILFLIERYCFMKIKQILATTGLAALLAVGAGVGVAANRGGVSVKAAGGTEENHTIYVAVSTSTVESDAYTDFNVRVNSNIGDSGTWRQKTLTKTSDTTTYEGMTVFAGVYVEKYGGLDNLQIQLYDGNTWKEQKEPVTSWDTTSYAGKLYNYSTGEWVEGYTPSITYRTVTQYAVKDGVLDSTNPISVDSSVIDGSSYDVPSSPVIANYHFEGWYLNEGCTEAFESAITVSADTSIYAKLTTFEIDSYIYWTDKSSSDLTDVYFYGEYAPTAWPGDDLSLYIVSDVLYYNGEGKLYKIPVPSNANYKMVINGSVTEDSVTYECKTSDLTVENERLYYTWFDNTYEKTKWYGASAVDSTAADFVARVETIRNNVEADTEKKILDYSVCGISPSDAYDLYNEYYGLSEADKALVDASYTYTYSGSYDGKTVPSETNVYFSSIMNTLKNIAEDGGYTVKGSSLYFLSESQKDNNMMIIIISSAAATALLATVLLILKKRKHNK